MDHLAGDGFMVLFSDPLPSPDPGDEGPSAWPRKCATWSPELSVKWRAYGPELDFGIGIARGYATLGRIGFEGRFDYSAIGTVVNLAAPLREAKAPAKFWLTATCIRRCKTMPTWRQSEKLTLKGMIITIANYAPLRANRGMRFADAAFQTNFC